MRFRGGCTSSTITLTSLGRLGGIVSTPVINHPEVAIVGVNRIAQRPVMRDGDVVGRPGRQVVAEHLPRLRREWALDFVVVNGENAAGGFGITEAIFEDLLEAGADVVTLGNHAFDQREAALCTSSALAAACKGERP